MIEETPSIETPDGQMEPFTVMPDGDGPFPAVILYMDAPGIRDELREFCRRIAAEGYYALLPDMYYRIGFRMTRFDEQGMKEMFDAMRSLNNELVMRDTGAMLSFLASRAGVASGPKGCIGYCMSGQYVVSAAGTYPDDFGAAASAVEDRNVDRGGYPDQEIAEQPAQQPVADAQVRVTLPGCQSQKGARQSLPGSAGQNLFAEGGGNAIEVGTVLFPSPALQCFPPGQVRGKFR